MVSGGVRVCGGECGGVGVCQSCSNLAMSYSANKLCSHCTTCVGVGRGVSAGFGRVLSKFCASFERV